MGQSVPGLSGLDAKCPIYHMEDTLMSKLLFFSFLSGLRNPSLVFLPLIMPLSYCHNNGIANEADSRKYSSERLHVCNICDRVIAILLCH